MNLKKHKASRAVTAKQETIKVNAPVIIQEEFKLIKDSKSAPPAVSMDSPVLKPSLTSLDHSQVTVATVVAPPPRPPARYLLAFAIMRCLLLDFPLMIIFSLYLASEVFILFQTRYLWPQLKLMELTEDRKNSIELTYYERHCDIHDITANTTDSLTLSHNVTPAEATLHMVRHGVQIYPNILSPKTSKAVRQYILERNPIEAGIHVIENKDRFSFGIDVNADPSIQQALWEITHHATLIPALEQIVGPNPAIIEFTAITSVYGAKDQFYHQDVVSSGSAFKYARNFLPSYSLFVPLQDITSTMGPTEVCPGSHTCQESIRGMCEKRGGVRLANENQNWKRGFGALINQQLFHRGTAHMMNGGPERVLFILTFAPRPRFGKNQVETRMIGHKGSYSLKWNQWGHTLSDFSSVRTKMTEPFKTARSLGLYAPTTQSWGWDMVTMTCMRIANSDTGYSVDNLENFVTAKGGLTWLPDFLKVPTVDEDTWKDWIMRQALNLKNFLRDTYLFMLGVYLSLMVFWGIVVWCRPAMGRTNVVGRAIFRLMMMHGMITLAVYLILRRVENGQWAKNIKYGKAFVGVHKADKATLPGTIPIEYDVLKSERYNSPYLASYNSMIDITHPGNQLWAITASNCATGFSTLTPELQRDLCAWLIPMNRILNLGRMLTQNEAGNWVEMSNEASVRHCHKDLMQLDSTNPMMDRMVIHLDYMISETRHGVWRDQAIHKVHVRDFLNKLQDKIIRLPPPKSSHVLRNSVVGLQMNVTVANTAIVVKSLASSPPSSRAKIVITPRIPVRQPYQKKELPFKSAWIQEGDVVDGQYRGTFNEWYQAKVLVASSNKGTFDVEYDDGDVDADLCRVCVRPYQPFAVDEAVAARDKENRYFGGRVVKVYSNPSTYDIQTTLNGLMTNLSTAEIRRFDRTLQLGSPIEAKYQGVGTIWYKGTIIGARDDGTFDVKYEDGDVEFEVEPRHIRMAPAVN